MNSPPPGLERLVLMADAFRSVGLRSAGWWLLYQARLRSGRLEARTPLGRWEEIPLGGHLRGGEAARSTALLEARSFPFFFEDVRESLPRGECPPLYLADLRRDLAECLAGRFLLWNDRYYQFGFPPDWHRNALAPFEGQPTASRHWSEIREGGADLKGVWELSRFSCAIRLARVYAYTGEEAAAEAFWSLFESWLAANPPNAGPNWMSGQEVALRSIGWVFAVRAFAGSAATTDIRLEQMLVALSLSARRIEATLDYALAQNNNHLVSEAAGLWTIGLLFPSLRQARRWEFLGRRLLLTAARRQFLGDGGYIQHSTNYHRLVLELYLWSIRLGEITGKPFPAPLYIQLRKSVAHLESSVDVVSGRAPNTGHNDGSLLLPLSSCTYEDFRPTVQALCDVVGLPLPYVRGPWDEVRLWLTGTKISGRQGSLPRKGWGRGGTSESSGVFLLGSSPSWGIVRCSQFRSRPAHADQLHVDLWWKGANLACDAGTYLYSGPAPWYNAFSHAAIHNGVVIDGRDQMSRLGRFLWARIAQGAVERFTGDADSQIWQGQHSGYRRLGVRHRRAVAQAGGRIWVIVDDLLGRGTHSVRLHWLLGDLAEPDFVIPTPSSVFSARVEARVKDAPALLELHSSAPASWSVVSRGQLLSGALDATEPVPVEIRGWQSTRYASLTTAFSLAGTARSLLPIRWISVWSLEQEGVEVIEPAGKWHLGREGGWSVELAPLGGPSIIRSVTRL